MDWKIPDWASVIGLVWAIGATACSFILKIRKRDVSVDAENFLLGLKASATSTQLTQINDQLARIAIRKKQLL